MVHLLLAIIYLAFVGLGLPDSMLGSAWPAMQGTLNTPVSYAGIISMIIAVGTVISSLFSDFLTKKLGAGKVTAVSVCITAIALMGFSFSNAFWMLILWAIPYGLGAGSVDAALNNYVALHYSSKHMNWLHCMWGVGTMIGPAIMGAFLTSGFAWNSGYLCVSIIQIAISICLFASLPLWQKPEKDAIPTAQSPVAKKPLSLIQVVKIPGAVAVMITFFCYCAAEATAILWTSSYMVLHNGLTEEIAALCASVFFIGITAGRAISGFISIKLNDTALIRIGESVLIVGCIVLFLPFGQVSSLIGIALVGLGCAPVYPSVIHSTPQRFGKENSQALIGVQMASAYVGTCLMPPLFGLIANHISISLFPVYLIVIFTLMILMHEVLVLRTKKFNQKNEQTKREEP